MNNNNESSRWSHNFNITKPLGMIFMNNKKLFCFILFTFLMIASNSIFAEGTGNMQGMDMEQMREMLKKQGVSEEQIKQMEGIMGDAAGKQAEHDAAILEKEQQEFEAAYGNHPTGHIDINDKSYTLRVTECIKRKGSIYDGTFQISAEQPPGHDDVSLGVTCCRSTSGGLGWIIAPDAGHTDGVPTTGKFNNNKYTWEGKAEFEGDPEAHVKIELSCDGIMQTKKL